MNKLPTISHTTNVSWYQAFEKRLFYSGDASPLLILLDETAL